MFEADALDLLLFVRGNGARAVDAIVAVRKACEGRLGGPHSLRVIDVFNQPELASKYRVIATPTLISSRGRRERRLVGHMSEQNVRAHFESEAHGH